MVAACTVTAGAIIVGLPSAGIAMGLNPSPVMRSALTGRAAGREKGGVGAIQRALSSAAACANSLDASWNRNGSCECMSMPIVLPSTPIA